jgi:hypothetical protein
MSDDKRSVVRVSAECATIIGEYAEKNKIGAGEAADRLIMTAHSRLASLARYAANQGAKPPGKPRAAKKAKATKKAPAKSKANGAAVATA